MSEFVRLPRENHWQVDGVEFVYSYSDVSTVERFSLRKPPDLVEQVVALCNAHRDETIVELGIAAGGSTAFIALLAQPRKLVACELEPTPVPALAELIEQRGLAETVRPHYGLDQADGYALAAVLDEEFGSDPIDLVIDDASHLYEPTRMSFEVIFPRLREGGLFVIEDWSADRRRRNQIVAAINKLARDPEGQQRLRSSFAESLAKPPPPPLHRLLVELAQVVHDRNDVVSEVSIDQHWIVVRRARGGRPHGFPDSRLPRHGLVLVAPVSWTLPGRSGL